MSNMSYCRFRNTLQDFQDCIDAIESRENVLNQVEKVAMLELYEQARYMSEHLYDDIEMLYNLKSKNYRKKI